jgi:hypothetical protein
MKKGFHRIPPLAWAVVGVLVGVTVASADLGKIIKGGAIAALVAQFADDLNDGINSVFTNKGIERAETTKVVPILSTGTGSYVGAAQVAGPEENVREVKAVAQVEVRLLGRKARVKALIPIRSENLIEKISRVDGVGVSAVIDIKL